MKRILTIMAALALVLTVTAAGAETISLSGTVEAGASIPVVVPIGGTVETVSAETGVRVQAGDVLATLRTEKVYASQDGTVTGVFVSPGDDAETVSNTFGACLYLEGTTKYTISGSTSKAYSSVDTTFVHVGEQVYIQCRSNTARSGEGVITAVDGTSYTVMVTSGDFIVGDSVNLYRDSEYSATQLLGRGSISRVSPEAVTASGAVVNVAVKNGDQVKKGDLLLETLTGTFDGYRVTDTEAKATVNGVIASVSATVGGSVAKGDAVVQIYPDDDMRVEAVITADERNLLKAGDPVTIELETDESKTYEGTVRYISNLPQEDAEETSYLVIIDFTPDDSVVYGMSVAVTAGKEDEPAEKNEEDEEDAEEAAETVQTEEKTSEGRPERPSGERPSFPEGMEKPEWNGEKPEKPAETETETTNP